MGRLSIGAYLPTIGNEHMKLLKGYITKRQNLLKQHSVGMHVSI